MNTHPKVRKSMFVLAFVAAGVAGCSGSSGGDTTCGDFLGSSTDDQLGAIEAMQEERGDSTGPTLALLSVQAYCGVHSSDSAIDGVYSG